MKRATTKFLMAALLLTVSLAMVQAQRGRGKGMPNYDPAMVVTLQGTVQEVTQHEGHMGWQGTHLSLKTESGVFDVHLGPSQFLADEGFEFIKGDAIEVTGSRTKYEGADAIIAREVKKGGKVLTLRDEKGVPKWSRGRWRW